MVGKFIPRIKYNIMNQLELLIQRYPVLESCVADIQAAFEFLKASYEKQGKLLVCGNGGSAADAEHIVGELMKGFKNPRKLSETAVVALQNVDTEMGEVLAQNLQGVLPLLRLVGMWLCQQLI